MTLTTTKNELWRIGKTYPVLAGLLMKKLPTGGTVGEHWARLLEDCDDAHLANVCDEYASLAKPLPEPTDQLPFAIFDECKQRQWKDEERLRVHELRLAARTGPADFMNTDRTGRIAVALGAQVRSGEITKEENDARMLELMAWDKGGAVPAWMDTEQESDDGR